MARTWNSLDKSVNVTLSGGDLTASINSTGGAVRTNTYFYDNDKTYFTVTINTMTSVSTGMQIGLANSLYDLGSSLITSNTAIGYRGDGAVVLNGTTVATLQTFTTGDVIHVAVDYENKRVWFKKNSGNWNNNASNNPATNVGGIDISAISTGSFIEIYGAVFSTGSTSNTTLAFPDTGYPTGFDLAREVGIVTTTGFGSFTVPTGATKLYVDAWGAGGAPTTGSSQKAGAGGAGYYRVVISVAGGDTLNYRVGAPAANSPGQSTNFAKNNPTLGANYWVAMGGSSINGGTNTANGSAIGTVEISWAGSNGAAAQGGGGSRGGSGAGSSATAWNSGSGGSPGSGSTGGAGGASATGPGGAAGGTPADSFFGAGGGGGGSGGGGTGGDGGAPGGGAGGGGSSSGANGTGGRGQLRYSYQVTLAPPGTVVNVTLAPSTMSATGLLTIVGSLNRTLTAATTASQSALTIIGSLNRTLSAATVVATGGIPPIVGTSTTTLSAATMSSASKLSIAAAFNKTLVDATLTSASKLNIASVLNQSVIAATSTSSGTLPIVGIFVRTLSAATIVSTGELAPGAGNNLNVTLAAATITSTGLLPIKGTLNNSLVAATTSSAGRLPIVGLLSKTLSAATLTSVSAAQIKGTLNRTLSSVSTAGQAALTIKGVLSKTLSVATLESTGGTINPAITPLVRQIVLDASLSRSIALDAKLEDRIVLATSLSRAVTLDASIRQVILE